jgi:hypothetical protein
VFLEAASLGPDPEVREGGGDTIRLCHVRRVQVVEPLVPLHVDLQEPVLGTIGHQLPSNVAHAPVAEVHGAGERRENSLVDAVCGDRPLESGEAGGSLHHLRGRWPGRGRRRLDTGPEEAAGEDPHPLRNR